MKKRLLQFFIFNLPFIAILSASASVPVRWTVETSRVQPAQIEAYHGETLELEAALQSYGKPLAITNDFIGIYWQTNGMGSAYWTAPAVLSNNVMIARFEPSMDVGANVYSCFIGAPGEIYRAAFQLRLRQSPGAVPSELPLPAKTLDFAQVEVHNAPYYTRSETDARIIELAPTPGNYATVSNRAMNAVQPAALAEKRDKTDRSWSGRLKAEYTPIVGGPSGADWSSYSFVVSYIGGVSYWLADARGQQAAQFAADGKLMIAHPNMTFGGHAAQGLTGTQLTDGSITVLALTSDVPDRTELVTRIKSGNLTVTPVLGTADVASLFSTTNTSGNSWIDGRISTALGPVATALDAKRGMTDFDVSGTIKSQYLPITGGTTPGTDWSSYKVVIGVGHYELLSAQGYIGAVFDSSGKITSADPNVRFNGKAPSELMGEIVLATFPDGIAKTSDIIAAVDHTDIHFSNEVLAVGLNIDTNSVAQINAILNDHGGVPIGGAATTVGGLLFALAAAVAWLKKNAITYARKHDILCGEPIVQFVDKTHIKVVGEISVLVNGTPVYLPHDVLTERGAVEKGRDYAVCLSADGTISVEPYDYDTATIEPTRRILGGFHTICRNVPADYQKPPVAAFGGELHELAGWSEGDILPMSVWSINFRPTAEDPTGMVYAKECDRWIDIYNGSGTIAAPRSRFGGTRLHTHTAVEFMTGYGKLGKWLLNDESFWFAAVGSNCGTKVKGSAQPNPDTTGAHLDTENKPMISSIGCEECCGLQAQWLKDISVSDGGGWDNSTYPTTAFAGGANAFGSHYNMRLYRAIRAGGAWTESSGVSIGPLHRLGANSRSVMAVDVGGRGSSRSTHPCSSI